MKHSTHKHSMKPFLLINAKSYPSGIGEEVQALAQYCKQAAEHYRTDVALAVQPTELASVSATTQAYAQHIDEQLQGAHTGSINGEAVKRAGATGTLLNHAEKKLPLTTLQSAVVRARQLGLVTVVCAATQEEVSRIAQFKPDYIALEPPELIGGNVSVTTASPDIITKAVHAADPIPLLCGAGIKTAEDAAKARALGAAGILVASGVMLAQNKQAVLRQLLEALQQ